MKITSIKQQTTHPGRYSVFLDDKFAFSFSESALIQSGIHSGMSIDKDLLSKLKSDSSLDKLYARTLKYVTLRLRSEHEVLIYLIRKGLDPADAQPIISRLRGVGLVNDADFAKSWVQGRRRLKNSSQRRLRLELKQKGLAEEVIDQALSEDQADELSVLKNLVQKKQSRYPDRQKLMRYLSGQGFNYDDIKTVLSNLD